MWSRNPQGISQVCSNESGIDRIYSYRFIASVSASGDPRGGRKGMGGPVTPVVRGLRAPDHLKRGCEFRSKLIVTFVPVSGTGRAYKGRPKVAQSHTGHTGLHAAGRPHLGPVGGPHEYKLNTENTENHVKKRETRNHRIRPLRER